jgi:hypothetical protein
MLTLQDDQHSIAPATSQEGLSLKAADKYWAAQLKTAWGKAHQRRVTLTEGDDVLASAVHYDLAGALDGRAVRICGVGSLDAPPRYGAAAARTLLEQLLDRAARDGAELALLFSPPDWNDAAVAGFTRIAGADLTLNVQEPPRRGAPMTMVRSGEDRDLQAVAAMGRVRAEPCRFHLDRDIDLIQHAITRKRLRAGLGAPGQRQLQFFIAEEGLTAAAYVVLSVAGATWTIEECGDRDASGARVGALLQALIAREPAESRPLVRGWLPPRFLPPQLTVIATTPSPDSVLMRRLGITPAAVSPPLDATDVLYWRNDVF